MHRQSTGSKALLLGTLLLSLPSSVGAQTTPLKQLPDAPPVQRPYLGPMAPTSANLTSQATTAFTKLTDFTVDGQNRQHVRAFFNSIYSASENTPLVFDGDVTACAPGTTNALFKDAVRLRINWFRELAGVADTISFRTSYSSDAQDAALIMAANSLLTHNPAPGLTCYTSSGDNGAGSSNLALGTLGWDSITGYMEDAGSNNFAVGHRRWLLHPPIQEMGTGDIPAASNNPATNSVWVFDDHIFETAATRDGFVAWPAPVYTPHAVVPARWSFSLQNANFANATVSMTRDGTPISTTLEPLSQGAGMNSLVWVPLGLDADAGEPWPQPLKDEAFGVSVNNVLVDGEPQNFNYTVRVFDAAEQGENDVLPAITGPATAETGNTERYSFDPVGFAEAYRLRHGILQQTTAVEGAEDTNADITDRTDASYPLFTTGAAASGSSSFHLAHPTATDQHFVWNRRFRLSDTSTLNFSSRLGFASVTQVARAQISFDDGHSWRTVFSQTGNDASTESVFVPRSIDLGDFAGEVVQVRFLYELLGGSFFFQTSPGVGFNVDDIHITDAEELTAINEVALGNTQEFSFTPESAGAHLLQVQYLGWDGFAGSDWGPGQVVDVTGQSANTTAVAAAVLPASRSVFATTATAFATMINGGSTTATGCRIAPQSNAQINFDYQTTNPATNALTGTQNTPVDIPAGEFQTFALFLEPTAAFGATDIHLSFDCANSAPAQVVSGLNTLLLSSGSGPVPDVVALAAAGPTGIVDIPGNTGTGVFAVATVNVGASGDITASASTQASATVLVCQTNPGTGACLANPAPSVTTSVATNETPTFGFFVTGTANVPFDPANNRVTVTFDDTSGVTRGATSVAIRTQ